MCVCVVGSDGKVTCKPRVMLRLCCVPLQANVQSLANKSAKNDAHACVAVAVAAVHR